MVKANTKEIKMKVAEIHLGKTEVKHLKTILTNVTFNHLSVEERNTLRTFESILRQMEERL